jgi:hypothetical protein
MRLIFTLALTIIWIGSFGQSNKSEEIPDCEVLTLNVVNQLSEKLELNQLDSFDIIINDWINSCSISECTQRLIIIKNILDKEESKGSIRTYFENEFHLVLKYRIEDSKKINYGYIYSGYKAYYGYVPLRHSIDSIVQRISINLLKGDHLSPDEKLICIMFSGDTEKFEKEIKSHEYNESYIKQYLLRNFRDNNNSWLAYTIYTGVYRPISSNDIFTYSPMFGLTFSSPLRNKLIVELGIKFRLNVNDKSFDYYALGVTNNVNSDVSIFFGGLVSYKLYEREKLILLPKVGVGLETVDTGLSEEKDNSEDKKYLDIETIHLSFGISAMTPVFRKSYLGLGLNYHFCPYGLDENLLTDFDNNLISAELFWRF